MATTVARLFNATALRFAQSRTKAFLPRVRAIPICGSLCGVRGYSQRPDTSIRNVAIIAHVDHGKTTLVDKLLEQSGFLKKKATGERVMDSDPQEKERGITILAKCTSVLWKDVLVNIVDTPGHGDFGGEVERVLGMVNGVVLLVDASEGVQIQTKFVLSKALKANLKPIVVLNKMDRPSARSDQVETEVFDLFVSLEATDEQLQYPTLYASSREGWAITSLSDPRKNLEPLFDTIIEHIPPSTGDADAPFRMLVSILETDAYLGRILMGRVLSGKVRVGDPVKVMTREGGLIENARVNHVVARRGVEREDLEEAVAGNIIGISGFSKGNVTDTVCNVDVTDPVPTNPIDPPVISMTILANDSPLNGKEGTKVTSTLIQERLIKETEGNVAINVLRKESDAWVELQGRGELQLGVLIENMRREGFELTVSPPRVMFKQDERGNKLEPCEEVIIDVDNEHAGMVIEKMSTRKGDMVDMKNHAGRTRLQFLCPSRGLFGFRSELNTLTSGSAVINHTFHSYQPYKGPILTGRKGALISTATGKSTMYALAMIEERGSLFISPGIAVYEGMVIGENSRDEDLYVNPVKEKQLTNVRSVQKDDLVRLSPPRMMNLEQAMCYLRDDEYLEVTPKSIRLRKQELNADKHRKQRKRETGG
eukprot:TRINITY_DN3586_c0_g1_i3.p1 TRINITY_DN3586_c0_g1~~TRINITY_DN3586_c0_g1_i3.p1  ORF type:complete len:653 (+),score=175.18 TRINITY_DN3586_c0_g1_i3:52-2010(+)